MHPYKSKSFVRSPQELKVLNKFTQHHSTLITQSFFHNCNMTTVLSHNAIGLLVFCAIRFRRNDEKCGSPTGVQKLHVQATSAV